MTDQSNVPTIPPPPDPSADAVYVVDQVLSKLGQLRVEFNTALGDLHDLIGKHVGDVKVLADRVVELHQLVPHQGRKIAKLEREVEGLKAEWAASRQNGPGK